MPTVDFNNIDDVDDFTPLPEGQYPGRLDRIEEAQTKHGDEMWKLRFVVESGEYMGRYIFDNMVFSEAALKRVKLICSRMGLDVSGETELTPESLKGRSCLITVGIEDYGDDEGKIKTRNVVPFAGYDSLEADDEDADEENVPF